MPTPPSPKKTKQNKTKKHKKGYKWECCEPRAYCKNGRATKKQKQKQQQQQQKPDFPGSSDNIFQTMHHIFLSVFYDTFSNRHFV